MSLAEYAASLQREEHTDSVCSKCNTEFLGKRCPTCGTWREWPTLGEWGQQLPIGVEEGGKLNKSFHMVPLTWKSERDIGRSWGDNRSNLSVSEYLGTILAYSVTQVGSIDIEKMKIPNRILVFNQMYQADVFYLYAYLRYISLGREMTFKKLQCLGCKHEFDYTADLTSLEVAVIEKREDIYHDVELRDGYQIGDKVFKKMKLKSPIWNTFGTKLSSGKATEADLFAAFLLNSVVSIEGLPDGITITEAHIEQMSAYDVAQCQQIIDDVLVGPRWEVDGDCPKCSEHFYQLIDWNYDRFFSLSSRSARRGKQSKR